MQTVMIGTKFEVVKGGTVDLGNSTLRLKVGEIWDIVGSEVMGPQLRKLNQRGGSTCYLNGMWIAGLCLRLGKFRVMDSTECKYLAHDLLRQRTGAR